jgi:copper resistance protein C
MRLKLSLLAAMLLTTGLALPAVAHDQLVDIRPSAGERIDTGDFEAVLTFNNPLLIIDGQLNAELATRSQDSSEWLSHPVEVQGSTLKAEISLKVSGEYQLRWKVVSSDGHAIEGESDFVLVLNEAVDPEPVAKDLIAPAPTEQSSSQGANLGGFYFGLALVILGAVFAPIGLMMRRRARKF